MKKKTLIVIIVIAVLLVLGVIGYFVVPKEETQQQEQQQEQEEPEYWHSDISRYSLEYYSKNIVKARCNYPSTFSMTSGVKIQFLDEPNIRTSGTFRAANAFGTYENRSFIINFKYNASSKSFTLVNCTII